MSFGNFFDGYCVIHAPFINNNRKKHFEKELARVGVNVYTVIEAQPLNNQDIPASYKANNPKGRLSLIRAIKDALTLASSRAWRHLVIFEDDVIFRYHFLKWWEEAERDVRETQWDILFLYRWPKNLLTIENARAKTTLIAITDNLCNHCVIVNKSAYPLMQHALDYAIQQSWHADFIYGHLIKKFKCRIYATTKNLAGQAGNFSSSLSGLRRSANHYAMFRACRSKFEFYLINALFYLRKRFKNIFNT